jgi:hypothetical protein
MNPAPTENRIPKLLANQPVAILITDCATPAHLLRVIIPLNFFLTLFFICISFSFPFLRFCWLRLFSSPRLSCLYSLLFKPFTFQFFCCSIFCHSQSISQSIYLLIYQSVRQTEINLSYLTSPFLQSLIGLFFSHSFNRKSFSSQNCRARRLRLRTDFFTVYLTTLPLSLIKKRNGTINDELRMTWNEAAMA